MMRRPPRMRTRPNRNRVPDRPVANPDGDEPGLATVLLKYFFLLVALGLTASTALGLWMGLKQMRRQRIAWLLVLAGTLTPLVLLMI